MKGNIKIAGIILTAVFIAGCGKQNASESDASAVAGQIQETNEAASNQTVKLRVGIGAAADSSLGRGVEYFGDVLREKSDGKIQVELCTGSILGGDRETIEGGGLGTVEMCNIATGPIANFSEKFLALDLPYVVTDRETAYQVLDGEKGRDILDSLENSGIYAMSFWELGFRDLYNTRKIIEHPEDVKDLKIRVMENDVYISLFNGLGGVCNSYEYRGSIYRTSAGNRGRARQSHRANGCRKILRSG